MSKRKLTQEELNDAIMWHELWLFTGKGSPADLHDTDLQGLDLHDHDLSGINLSGANLKNANLSNVKLWKVEVSGTEYIANLSGADLSNANLLLADCEGTDFRDANMLGTNLKLAFLYEVQWKGAKNLRLEDSHNRVDESKSSVLGKLHEFQSKTSSQTKGETLDHNQDRQEVTR